MVKMPHPPMGMVVWECLTPGVVEAPKHYLDTAPGGLTPLALMPELGPPLIIIETENFSFPAVVDRVEVHFRARVLEEVQ